MALEWECLKRYPTGAKCIIEQYKMLKRCSKKQDITEWNEWRVAHPDEEVFLQGANLRSAHLEHAELTGAHVEGAMLTEAHLEGARLDYAHLEGAWLAYAHLEGAWPAYAYLEGARLMGAHMEGAHFYGTHLEGASLNNSHLEGAELAGAHMEGASLQEAHLEGARLYGAHLEGASLTYAALQGTGAAFAVLDGATLMDGYCKVDKNTDFRGVGLRAARVDPGLLQLLEYNVRRKRWEEYYRGRWYQRIIGNVIVRPFWLMSDYGRSTGRIIISFFVLAALFAGIYFASGYGTSYPEQETGMVRNLFVVTNDQGEREVVKDEKEAVARCLYFSVVTMTTLGFGDMYARPASIAGYAVLSLQVMLGYVLLGALVTRFAVLFQAGGPAGKFSKRWRGLKAWPG